MRAALSIFTAIALLFCSGLNAQQAGAITTCTCSGFHDAKGKSLQVALLVGAPLVNGMRVSSNYGMRMHPILAYYAMHWGVDFAATLGAPIFSSADGVIEEAREKGDFGNYIFVRHSRTVATTYAHASRFAPGIRPGVHVKRGQVIAYVGSTGLSTGPHLHYEVLVNGWRVEPICSCVPPAPRIPPMFTAIFFQYPLPGSGAIQRVLVGSAFER